MSDTLGFADELNAQGAGRDHLVPLPAISFLLMKLLHCIASVNPAGGGPIEGIKQRAKCMAIAGHSVEILSLDSPSDPWVADCPVKVEAVGPGFGAYRFAWGFVSRLRAIHERYDAVIVNGLWQYNSLATWRTLRNTDTPYFVFTHGMLDPWFKRAYPLKHLKKWIYWPWADYRVLRDARAVLFTCEEEWRLARQSFWLFKCNKRVVNYGTAAPTSNPEQQRATFLDKFPHLREKRIILFLSRIHEKKGCDLIIKAFARLLTTDNRPQNTDHGPRTSDLRSLTSDLRPLHLMIAGPCAQPAYLDQLKNLAAGLGLLTSDLRPSTSVHGPLTTDHITFSDMLNGDLKWGAFRSAEVFALPSRSENFGIVVAEALACGTPVLISNRVNIWREIEADGGGLVEDDTEAGAFRLLERWIKTDRAMQARMRDRALDCFNQRFEIQQAARSLIKTITECLHADGTA